jgi:hypothetical protein
MTSSEQTRVDRELLLNFFLTFSRFEYALKTNNYFKRPNTTTNNALKPPDAKPDWERFAVSLRDVFKKDKNAELHEACQYIIEAPPWKQVIVNNAVAWESPIRPESESEIEFILRMVRSVRNNLFHGGKFNMEAFEQTERTMKLLSCSIIILNECLTLSPSVKLAFDEAII